MSASDDTQGGEAHPVVYCLIPLDLAPKLHDLLRRHFRDAAVEVVVERRAGERRSGEERRQADSAVSHDRRRIRSRSGRRVGEQRAPLVHLDRPPSLPRRAQRFADRLTFVERLEPSSEKAQDQLSARLVLSVQAGDPTAFSDLYLRHFDGVYAYLRVALKDAHEAEDGAQNVFTTVFEALPKFELRPGTPFRAWLFRIARNEAISYLRKSGRLELEDPTDIEQRRGADESEATELGLDWVSDTDLLFLIERLPVAQRQVLTLRYMLGLSNREIAAVLDTTPAAVSQHHSRARRFLGDRLRAVRGEDRRRRTPRAPMLIRLRRMPVLGARRGPVPFRTAGSARYAASARRR